MLKFQWELSRNLGSCWLMVSGLQLRYTTIFQLECEPGPVLTRPLQWYDLPPGSKNVLFKVSFTSQTSGSNNKLDIGTFKLGHPRLTNSKTNNKRDIGTFKFGHHHLTLNEGPKVKPDYIKRFPAHVFL